MASRPMPFPQTDLSPIRVPVFPKPFFQSISRMPVVPTPRPSTSTTQMMELGSLAVLPIHSFSISTDGGFPIPRKRAASRSSNHVTITKASSCLRGGSRTRFPWMTGPYMGGKYERGSEDLTVPRVGDRLRRFWDFDDLELSEERFLAQLEHETSDEGRAEVLTQLARLHGLREQFSEGERLITEAEALAGASVIAGIRIQLERGRLRRSLSLIHISEPTRLGMI